MKKSGWFLLLLVCVPCCLSAQKTRYGEGLPRARPGVSYPLKVHVSAMRLRTECQPLEGCAQAIYLDAALNGQKVELSGFAWLVKGVYDVRLLPGDYQARLLKDQHKVSGTPLYQEYEILLPDGTVWGCTVTGVSE
jgi:hypothetical protein